MKKILISLLVLCGMAVGTFFIMTQDKNTQETVDTNSETGSRLKWLGKTEVTPDEQYTFGAFCRINYVESDEKFFVSFGGTNTNPESNKELAERAGGAEGGNGYSYKIYNEDLEYTGGNGILTTVGGDAASVYAEGYYYFLVGAPEGWKILKIETDNWKTVDSVIIEMDQKYEARNDQMLAYANGYLIASSLYNKDNSTESFDQLNTDPHTGYATHNRIFTTDLEQVDYFILDDTGHINASYVVFENGIYNYISSTSLFGDLIVMRYDEDWNYLGVKTLAEHGNWSQGAVYDPDTKNFYVAYIDFGPLDANGRLTPGNAPNTILGVYDSEWNFIEKIDVTNFTAKDLFHAGRPSVTLKDDKLYVSYDVESFTSNMQEKKDWQCHIDEYQI